jgi:hypothetical protein
LALVYLGRVFPGIFTFLVLTGTGYLWGIFLDQNGIAGAKHSKNGGGCWAPFLAQMIATDQLDLEIPY